MPEHIAGAVHNPSFVTVLHGMIKRSACGADVLTDLGLPRPSCCRDRLRPDLWRRQAMARVTGVLESVGAAGSDT